MTYRAIFSDLDGTALNNAGAISEENFQAITELHERGMLFIPTTGRSLYAIPTTLLEHPYVRYFVTANGATIYDKQVSRFVQSITISGKHLRYLRDQMARYTTMPIVHHNGYSYAPRQAYENYRYYRVPEYYRTCGLNMHILDNFDTELAGYEEIEMISLFFRYDEEMATFQQALQDFGGFQITASCEYALEVIADGVNKGTALRTLASMLSIAIQETVAMGDSKNDITMLDEAGLALAMSNACAEAKTHADRVICSNEEHGIDYLLHEVL